MKKTQLKKIIREEISKILKEELVYQFSEYDYDITEEEGYQEDVITRIKEELPTVDHEEIMKMIRSIEDYYYDEARKENKRGREYPSVSSEDFAGEVIWNLEELGLAENIIKEDIEEISITGDYMGEPEIYSGHNFRKFLKEMLELALNEDDFVNKVIMGVTDETSSISLEDEMKLRSYYTVYKK